jgi:hypothetical protein
MSTNNTTPNSEKKPALNSRARRQIARANRKKKVASVPTDPRQISSDVHVYTDDSYKDKRKKVYSHGLAEAKERIKAINAKFNLPERISTALKPFKGALRFCCKDYTSCLITNRDGRVREFLPDTPGDHRILVHRSVARQMVSGVCMLVRITANEDKDGNTIDGSWAIVPAQYRMMNATTIQEVRRRPFFFLRRYWYEITFDGRVQPAHLLFDYGLNPMARRTRFYITHEYVPVRKQDATNDYFRFWHHKPCKTASPS